MLTSFKRIGGALLGLSLGICCSVPALADDTEIYVNSTTPSPEVRPNILFIVDTSGSMKEADSFEPRDLYKSDTTYTVTGKCSAGRIFFRRGGEAIPNCNSDNYILEATTTNKCAAMRAAVAGISGTWTGKTAQYNDVTQSWRDLSAAGTTPPIECQADRGVDGDGSGGATWARNGDKDNKWSSSAAAEIDWNQNTTYTFYSANWMNWHSIPAGSVATRRIDAVKQAVISMTSSIDGVNLGLMRYSNNGGDDDKRASGGYVVQAVDNVTTNRAAIVKAANEFTADGFTPLSETLYEAYLYYAGQPVLFGNSSVPGTSVDGARKTAGGDYKSPIIGECQKSYIIYLTDGLPTADNEADEQISKLDHGVTNACSVDTDPDVNQSPGDDGICLDDMAHYLKNHDLSSTLNDDQNVTTYTIGFGSEVKGSKFLTKVAAAGGGERFDAQNSDQLTQVLTKITEDVLNTSTTFTTASVGVNAFNRAQTRDELYFAMFDPKENLRWDGNLKKYKLAVNTAKQLIITGQDGTTDAIDQSKGVFKDTTQSFWSTVVDGDDATAGGAASRLPNTRKIYTYLGNNPKGSGATLVALNTAAADDFGTGTTADERTATLAFAYGTDTKRMGDPLHSTPQVVTYDKTTDVVYVATNDGYLHAVDAASGVEQWAFVPKELLPRLKQLLANPAVTNRTYGLDGDITVLRFDKNNDGIIDTTDDRVWLYVGMRRGGHSYYAVDVTNPAKPTLLWVDDDSVLPGLGETWSAPVVTRVDVKDASQNSQKLVLIFGGGYDSAQEGNLQVDDATGNRLFMVDAKTGDLLWYATRTGDKLGTGSQQGLRTEFDKMTNSFPGRLTVIDTNGDLFADRIYAGDMGGRIWRFDIFNTKPVGELVTGGVFAELGQGQVVSPATPDLTETRRFYNAPDVALVQRRGADPYYNIAIGSGYRGHPLKTDTVDRFYSLRDKQPFTKFSQSDYNSRTPLTDGMTTLVDITNDPQGSTVSADSDGWKYVFKDRKGEKVLAESTTASDVILVPTYQPDTSQQATSCRPHSNSRVYAFRVDDGSPVLDLNKDKDITNADISTSVMHEGILGNVNVGLLRGDLLNKLDPNASGAQTVCLAGMHILGQCVQVNDSVRTFWRKDYDGTESP
jgi:type IV pilus assembly protein PilY1